MARAGLDWRWELAHEGMVQAASLDLEKQENDGRRMALWLAGTEYGGTIHEVEWPRVTAGVTRQEIRERCAC